MNGWELLFCLGGREYSPLSLHTLQLYTRRSYSRYGHFIEYILVHLTFPLMHHIHIRIHMGNVMYGCALSFALNPICVTSFIIIYKYDNHLTSFLIYLRCTAALPYCIRWICDRLMGWSGDGDGYKTHMYGSKSKERSTPHTAFNEFSLTDIARTRIHRIKYTFSFSRIDARSKRSHYLFG